MRLIHHPILCNYYVTYRCNASCDFCDIWEKPSPYVTFEQVENNLRDLKKLGVRVVDFTGGEPLLHREIDQFLTLAKESKLITTLTTNALLYPKWAERLKGKVDMLHFSLDYADAAKHDEVRGVACFEAVMRSIAIAKDMGERPDILMTVFDENMDQIQRIYEEVCLPNNLLLILNPVFDYNEVKNHGGLSKENLLKLKEWGKRSKIYLNNAFIDLRLKGGNDKNDPVCKAASTTIVISPFDELVMPCYHLGTFKQKIDGELITQFQSKKSHELRMLEGRMDACQGCAINCYMEPSFAVDMNKYWWKSLPSTLKYNRVKGTWKQFF